MVYYQVLNSGWCFSPLYNKFPINCRLNGASQYNENFARKMGLDISRDRKWMKMCITLWKEVEEQVNI